MTAAALEEEEEVGAPGGNGRFLPCPHLFISQVGVDLGAKQEESKDNDDLEGPYPWCQILYLTESWVPETDARLLDSREGISIKNVVDPGG